jgi:hypothetical protein
MGFGVSAFSIGDIMELVLIACCISGFVISRPIVWALGLR